MNRFTSLLQLDLVLIIRNKILLVAVVITALYTGILQVLPEENFTMIVTTLIFTDPVMLGFMFIGVMVLFEKSGNTLQAMSVSPVRPAEYLWSKATALTLIALAAGLIMAVAGVGVRFHAGHLVAAIVFSSLLFVFVGFVGVSKVNTFNQYFIIIPLFMVPGFLPFLNYFGITDTWLLHFIPTQAALILFTAAFGESGAVTIHETIYAFIYLPLSIWLAFLWAQSHWNKIIER